MRLFSLRIHQHFALGLLWSCHGWASRLQLQQQPDINNKYKQATTFASNPRIQSQAWRRSETNQSSKRNVFLVQFQQPQQQQPWVCSACLPLPALLSIITESRHLVTPPPPSSASSSHVVVIVVTLRLWSRCAIASNASASTSASSAMGRKKIQISRITDERNRQVRIFFVRQTSRTNQPAKVSEVWRHWWCHYWPLYIMPMMMTWSPPPPPPLPLRPRCCCHHVMHSWCNAHCFWIHTQAA